MSGAFLSFLDLFPLIHAVSWPAVVNSNPGSLLSKQHEADAGRVTQQYPALVCAFLSPVGSWLEEEGDSIVKGRQSRKGFTVIELLIVVIVIGVLASAGLAKYQNFAETSRRSTCLKQLQTIENAWGVWETTNIAFAESCKSAWGFTTRTGKITSTENIPTELTPTEIPGAIPDSTSQPTASPPLGFVNNTQTGPLNSVIRDDKVWVCATALSRYYGAEIQNVPDDYLDVTGGGVDTAHSGAAIGFGGRYLAVVAGLGNRRAGTDPIVNGGFPTGWIHGAAVAASDNALQPCPQTPFKMVICGSWGSFGPGINATTPGTDATNQGGPVGPDGSSLNRHSARW